MNSLKYRTVLVAAIYIRLESNSINHVRQSLADKQKKIETIITSPVKKNLVSYRYLCGPF